MVNDNPTNTPRFCPCCGQPLRVDRQPNYRRIDGKLTEVGVLWLCTCDAPDCPFAGFTVTSETFSDPAERARYGIEHAPYDVLTGQYIPTWKRYSDFTPEAQDDFARRRAMSNAGPDKPRSRWERRAYELHSGKSVNRG